MKTKQIYKTWLALLLAVSMMVSIIGCGEGNGVSTLSNHTLQTNTSFRISDQGIAIVYVDYTGYDSAQDVEIKIEIQKRTALFFWERVVSQTHKATGEYFYQNYEYPMNEKGTYRCTVSYTVRGDDGKKDTITFEKTISFAGAVGTETTQTDVPTETTKPTETTAQTTPAVTYPPATVPSVAESTAESTTEHNVVPPVGHVCKNWAVSESGYRITDTKHVMKCTECGYSKWFEHEYGQTPCTSNTVACTLCGYEREPGPYASLRVHNYVNGECVDCHELEIHAGLLFLYDRYYIGDERFYSICGLGTYTSSHLTIPDMYCGIPVKKIYDSAFANSSLESVVIPETVEIIGSSAFAGAEKLSRVEIRDGVESIENHAFASCMALTEIILPATLESMGGSAFRDCTSLRSVTFREGAKTVGSSAFLNCTALTDVKLASTIQTIGSQAFQNCIALESIVLPTSYGTKKHDASEAFKGCVALTTVVFEEGGRLISTRMFEGCVNLTQVVLPSTLTNVYAQAFKDCEKLTEFHYRGTRADWMKVEISKTKFLNGDIICSDGTLTKAVLEEYFSKE